jgi:hypothetical protein
VLEGLRHRDPRLRGLRRVGEDVAAVVQLLDDVGARRLCAQAALLHHLDQLALTDAGRRRGLLALHLDALEIELLPLLELGDLGVRGARVCVDRREAGVEHDRAADEVRLPFICRRGALGRDDVGAGRLADHRRREGGKEAPGDQLIDPAVSLRARLETLRVDRLRRIDRRVVGRLLLAAGGLE